MHVLVLRSRLGAFGAINRGQHIQRGTPFSVRPEVYLEAEPLVIDFPWYARCNPGFAHELLPLVSENQALPINPPIKLAGALEQRILHLEKIGEVCVGFDPDI